MITSDKGSESHSEIVVDLGIIRDNLELIKRHIDPGTRMMAVVKANAYGHGSVEVARAIRDSVQWLAVNDAGEGIELREAGIELPILVFGVPEERTAKRYREYDLTATVSRLSHFALLEEGTRYHLNFDTGMGRLGLSVDEIQAVKKQMEDHSALHCTGIYSHLATADQPDSPKVLRQLELFRNVRKEFSPDLLTHVSNTGGALYYNDTDFDMVRTGIGMYGYPPAPGDMKGLKPALEWISYLAQVKKIGKGDTVSYGAAWEAPEEGYIGVVPVGYEDGLRRLLSGKIKVSIEGRPYPQAGTITMNYFMVYLGQNELPEGTEVAILHKEGFTAEQMAQKLQTISYEVLVSLSRQIPRRYP